MRIESDSHLHGEVIPPNMPSPKSMTRFWVFSEDSISRFVRRVRSRRRDDHSDRSDILEQSAAVKKPFLLPVDQAAMNKSIDATLRSEGMDHTTNRVGEFRA